MRKLIFIGIVAVGALVGLLSAVHDDWATRLVMAAVGSLFGSAIGGALTFAGRHRAPRPRIDGTIPGMGSSTADIAANYWRDKGSPPFMKAPSAVPDKHMFDPDKLG
jgi:hypothetical protein